MRVALTDGSVVAMSYVIKVFGESGKNLVCATPTFGMYKVYADMQGMNTVFVHYEDDYTFNVQKLLDAIDDNTGIVSLVNPSMPIGDVYTTDEISQVVSKAEAHNALVIIGEAIVDNADRLLKELGEKFKAGKAYLLQRLEKESYKYLPTYGCFVCITPKQFLSINDKPVIVHTVLNFERNKNVDAAVVVCVKEWIPQMQEIVAEYSLGKVKWVIPGGIISHDSTSNALFFLRGIA